MKLKIILLKNGKRFDRLYNLIETDIFDFYSKLLNENLAPLGKEIAESGGYATIDLTTETLAASVTFHGVSEETKEEIQGLLFPNQ